MPNQIRNTATIVAGQNISSAIAHLYTLPEKKTVKWEGGDAIDEGALISLAMTSTTKSPQTEAPEASKLLCRLPS